MQIKKQGDPKKTRRDPETEEYYFACEVCGCEFVEHGTKCNIAYVYCNQGAIFEVMARCNCPNCRREVTGQRM